MIADVVAVMNADGSLRAGQTEPKISKDELVNIYKLMIRLRVRAMSL